MSMARSLDPRPARRPVRALRVTVLAVTFALIVGLPVHAAPSGPDPGARPAVWATVLSWLHGLLGAPAPAPGPDSPEALFLPEGCHIDPNGAPCDSSSQTEVTPPLLRPWIDDVPE